jgi:hypothetical protein
VATANYALLEVQALFFRRRHQPRRPPLAKYLGVGIRNSSASTIQLIHSSLARGFNFFSSVETRSRNSFMTL